VLKSFRHIEQAVREHILAGDEMNKMPPANGGGAKPRAVRNPRDFDRDFCGGKRK